MTTRAAVIAIILFLASSHFCAIAQDLGPSSKTKTTKKKRPATVATEIAPQLGSRSTINADGSIETKLPDGSKKVRRPGGCGFTMIAPNGEKSAVSCSQVQPATPPLPDQVSERWLEGHNKYLLAIIRTLFGNDQESVDNYLRNDEPPTTTLYDKIRLRTDLIAKLTEPQ